MKNLIYHLLLLLFFPSFSMGQAFRHIATAANISGHWTTINNVATNDRPNVLLFVTLDYGSLGPYHDKAIGVWYNSNRWTIFNQDRSNMTNNARFNIMVVERGENAFIHSASAGNTSGNTTTIDHPRLNGNPGARLLVTQSYGATGIYNNKSIGVYYTGSRWAIFNQDRSAMPTGAQFNVLISSDIFEVEATSSSITNNWTAINNPQTNDRADALLFVTQYWTSVYNAHEIGVWYTNDNARWNIYNQRSTSAMPPGAKFFVLANRENSAIPNLVNVPINPSAIRNINEIRNDVDFDNWGFEQGIAGWIVGRGNAYDNQPTEGETMTTDRALRHMELANGGIGGDYWKGMTYRIGIKGKNWVGTAENQNDASTGWLYSPAFKLTKRYISCLVGGTKKPRQIRVELQMKKSEYDALQGNKVMLMTGDNLALFTQAGLNANSVDGEYQIIKVAFPNKGLEDLERFRWELPNEALGKTFRIRIIDDATDGHINVDDFLFTNQPLPVIEFDNTSYDTDKPVWGFADTHAHPTHNLGFGGKSIVGSAGGNIAEEFSSAKCQQNHSDFGAGATNNPLVGTFDPHHMMGYPDFVGFPRFNSKLHQQQHVEWIKRAYEGGLRLLCALGVNNSFWATRAMGLGARPDAPIDDEAACIQQIEEMKRIAAQNASWMEIAYTPQEARQIILRGKMAVVLGVEMDNFGNFKDRDYTWRDNYPMPPSKPMVELPDDMPTATRMMQEKMNYYYNIGIRQVTPMHYINGVFGGTAQFRAEFGLINAEFHRKPYELKDGYQEGIAFHYLESAAISGSARFFGTGRLDDPNFPAVGSGPGRCIGCSIHNVTSTMCATGLTNKGEMMFRELMRKGFIVDMEHTSVSSADRIFSIASQYNYPVISSHTVPRDLGFKASYPARFAGTDEEKVRIFGTAVIGNLTQEGMLSAQNFDRIARSGGTVGVLAFPFREKAYVHPENRVVNDCDGSSKSWCQMYVYSLHKMRNKGVALSTDRGFNEFIAPRFGPYAAWNLKFEPTADLNKVLREQQKWAQDRAVRYANPFKFFHSYLYENGGINEIEEDAWKAIAYYHMVSTSSQNAPLSAYFGRGGRIKNFIDALSMNYEQASAFVPAGGSTTHERLAVYCVKNGITPQQLPDPRWHNDAWVNENYYYFNNVWQLWRKITNSTANEPLRRCRTGSREWDFNLEGLAHYGLIPDFLQDCKNVGLTPQQLKVLFSSAEDYIQMWEKSESAKNNVR